MKETNLYKVKNLTLEVKDIDNEGRKVAGYFASFDNIDSDNDMIVKGAFKKSLNERGIEGNGNRRIAHLRNHDWNQQIGKLLELKEDSYGLYFVSQLGRSTKGNDAFLDYQDGIIREHSIGFQYVPEKIEKKESSDFENEYYIVKEVNLFEGSAVTFGANELTPVLDVSKALDTDQYLNGLNQEMNVLLKALRNGTGTDERLYSIEMNLKLLQAKYNALINHKPATKKATYKDDKPQPNQASKKDILINLINI